MKAQTDLNFRTSQLVPYADGNFILFSGGTLTRNLPESL